jgi:8-oxo-dGTP diphosphatase
MVFFRYGTSLTKLAIHCMGNSSMTEVVCALIESEGAVLACQRPPQKHLAGLWELPGGKVEPGESNEMALLREIEEELGIDVFIHAALSPVEWADSHVQIRLHPYHCRIRFGTPIATEHSQIRWCTTSDLHVLEWAQADIPILKEWQDLLALRLGTCELPH